MSNLYLFYCMMWITFPVKRGIRLGDSLSQLLFNIFINDIKPYFNENESRPVKLNTTLLPSLFYADDLVISESAPGLRNSLTNLQQYCKKWKLDINLNITKIYKFIYKMDDLSHNHNKGSFGKLDKYIRCIGTCILHITS